MGAASAGEPGRMKTEHIDVGYVARLARLHLTPGETARFQAQLDEVLAYAELLREPDVEGVEPTAHAFPVLNVTRADEPAPCQPAEATGANAPAFRDGLFIVPRIIE